MVSYIGNNIKPKGVGLIPSRKVIEGGYRTIIGNGSGLFNNLIYLNPYLLNHTCNLSDRTILYDGVYTTGIAANDPAIRNVNIAGLGVIPCLQIEEASENLFLYSDDSDNAAWVKTRLSSSSNKLIPSVDNDTHLMDQAISFDGSSYYTIKVVAGEDEYDGVRIELPAGQFVGNPSCDFDLSTGTAGTPTDCTAYIRAAESGRYECTITALSDAAGSGNANIYVLNGGSASYAGDTSSGIQFARAQIEAKQWATSHIITTSSSEVRPPVECFWDAADVPNWVFSGDFKQIYIPYLNYTDMIFLYLLNPLFSASSYARLGGSPKYYEIRDITTGLCCRHINIVFTKYDILTILSKYNIPSVGISGADSGDGETAGTAWVWNSSNLQLGHYNGITYHCNGLLSPPIKL